MPRLRRSATEPSFIFLPARIELQQVTFLVQGGHSNNSFFSLALLKLHLGYFYRAYRLIRLVSVTMFGLRRSMATVASQASSLKQAGKVVCIGRNYA